MLFGFNPGASYRVTFSAAQRFGYTGQTWDTTINGSVIGSFAPPQSATSYSDFSATFSASSGSHLLTFVGTNLNGGDNTVFIDNVRVTALAEAPTISVVAADASATRPGTSTDAGSDTGTFTVTRSGTTTGTTTAHLSLGGSAIIGTDYSVIGNSVTFAPGETSKTITVTPLGGVQAAGGTTVIVTVAPGTDYTVGSPSNGTVTIADAPYVMWLRGFNFAPGADQTPTGNPVADGIPNLCKYALGLNPLVPAASPFQPSRVTVGANAFLQLSVPRNPLATHVLIEGLSAATLNDPGAWSTSTTVIEENTPNLFRVRDTLPIETNKMRFLKLRFTLRP